MKMSHTPGETPQVLRQGHSNPPRAHRPNVSRTGRATRLVLAGLCVLSATGCALQPPSPWEKGALARPEMTMAGDVLGDRFTQHIYTSKENASGGNGVGGGGCGCN